MYLSTLQKDKLSAFSIKEDVISKLTNKYGEPVITDELGPIPIQSISWKNREGLDIVLLHSMWDSELIKMSGLKLTFSYTTEMQEKIFRNNSIY